MDWQWGPCSLRAGAPGVQGRPVHAPQSGSSDGSRPPRRSRTEVCGERGFVQQTGLHTPEWGQGLPQAHIAPAPGARGVSPPSPGDHVFCPWHTEDAGAGGRRRCPDLLQVTLLDEPQEKKAAEGVTQGRNGTAAGGRADLPAPCGSRAGSRPPGLFSVVLESIVRKTRGRLSARKGAAKSWGCEHQKKRRKKRVV